MNSERLKAQVLSRHTVGSKNSETLYLVDSKHDLSGCVELYDTLPALPHVLIGNKNRLTIEYDLFAENALIDPDGMQHEQCEAIFWPKKGEHDHEWTFCIETKYSRDASSAKNPHNKYPQKMISQLCSTVFWFRNQGYLDTRKVHCVPSFPTVPDVSSMSALFQLPQNRFLVQGERLSIMEIADKYNILIRYANSIQILTDKRIKFNSQK
jgi:hypothetical protein